MPVLRHAHRSDLPRMQALIHASARGRTLFGGDQAKQGLDSLLQPGVDAARIRAFFVAPSAARQGCGSRLLKHCTEQARAEGFDRLELAATMPGVPFYRALGFLMLEEFILTLPHGIVIPLARMGLAMTGTR